MSSVHVRIEIPSDAAAIDAVTVAAFREAAHSSHTEHFIVAALRRAGRLSLSLVAEKGGAIVGHVAMSPVVVSDGAAGWYGLAPLSVAPGRQRQGIGTTLVRQALAELKGLGARGCVVLGDPAYYARFGFRSDPALRLPDVPPEYFQAIPFGEPGPCGTVAYDKAFAAIE